MPTKLDLMLQELRYMVHVLFTYFNTCGVFGLDITVILSLQNIIRHKHLLHCKMLIYTCQRASFQNLKVDKKIAKRTVESK